MCGDEKEERRGARVEFIVFNQSWWEETAREFSQGAGAVLDRKPVSPHTPVRVVYSLSSTRRGPGVIVVLGKEPVPISLSLSHSLTT